MIHRSGSLGGSHGRGPVPGPDNMIEVKPDSSHGAIQVQAAGRGPPRPAAAARAGLGPVTATVTTDGDGRRRRRRQPGRHHWPGTVLSPGPPGVSLHPRRLATLSPIRRFRVGFPDSLVVSPSRRGDPGLPLVRQPQCYTNWSCLGLEALGVPSTPEFG